MRAFLRSFVAAAIVAALLLVAVAPARGVSPRPGVLAAHAPISILGDSGFNATNGVVGGTGTAADPYVIAGWSIDAPPSIGVQIRGTTAHAVVRDVAVTAASVAAFYTYAVSNLTLDNVTALGSAGDGIRVESSHDLAVLASNVTVNHDGIILLNSFGVRVLGTNVSFNGGDGVTVLQSTAVLVQSNAFYRNAFGGGYGLDLTGSTNVTVLGNRFLGNDIYLDGSSPAEFNSHTIGADNLVSGLPVLYLAGRAGVALSGLQLGELLLASAPHARVTNLTTTGGDLGIEVAYSSDVVLGPNVTMSNAALGLRVASSSGVQLVDGAILETAAGVRIEFSTGVSVLRNRISAPFAAGLPDDGVAVLGSDRVNVSGNVIRHHLAGISVSSSGNVTLVGNVAARNVEGIHLEAAWAVHLMTNVLAQDANGLRADQTTNSTFTDNAFVANAVGANVSLSSGLRFVHGAFLGNATTAYDGNGTRDAWDGGYPAGGNFWWNYSGIDQCHGALQSICTGPDGIGDTPYAFNVGATDRYPLMQPAIPTDVPPEALFLVSSPIGSVLTAFRVSANVSSDYEDALNLLQVRWDWESNGTWTVWTPVKVAWHTFPAAGVHTIRLEVRDRAGLTDAWTSAVVVTPKPDLLPPAILTVPPAYGEVGQPIRIVANITDPSGVANATLLYRGVDGGRFRAMSMYIESGGTNFTASIPAQAHAGTVEYVIVANDTWANEARAPLSGVSTVPVTDTLPRLLLVVGVPVAIVAAAVIVAFLWWRRRRRIRRARPLPWESPPSSGGGPGTLK